MLSAGETQSALLHSRSARLSLCSLRSLAANFGFRALTHNTALRYQTLVLSASRVVACSSSNSGLSSIFFIVLIRSMKRMPFK